MDLVTSREQTRAGFISFALEKNRRSTPIIENAKSLKELASKASQPKDLLKIPQIRASLLSAAGISDKALNYFDEPEKDKAILALIENFLEPAGEGFVDETVYRYLLIKGDSLGGQMRNIVGSLAQQRLIRTLLSNMNIMGLDYSWITIKDPNKWIQKGIFDIDIENDLKAISWFTNGKHRVLAFNLKIPIVNKNVDICLFNCTMGDFDGGKIVNHPNKILMLGELKGGIDPAGADEHWKTGNSALARIRDAFRKSNVVVATSFVAAAIETSMSKEIWDHLISGDLANAANLTVDSQMVNYCDWLIKF